MLSRLRSKSRGSKQKFVFQIRIESIDNVPEWYQPSLGIVLKTNRSETIGKTSFKSVVSGGQIVFKQTFEISCSLSTDDFGPATKKYITLSVKKLVSNKSETISKAQLNLAEFVSYENEGLSTKQELQVKIHSDMLVPLHVSILCLPVESVGKLPKYSLAKEEILDRFEIASPKQEEMPVIESDPQEISPASPSFTDFGMQRATRTKKNTPSNLGQLHIPQIAPVNVNGSATRRSGSTEGLVTYGKDEIQRLKQELSEARREIAQLKSENQLLKEKLQQNDLQQKPIPIARTDSDLLDFF
jgi:hypothetical protein